MTHLQRMLSLQLGTTQLKQFDDAITSEVFNIMGVLQEYRHVDTVTTVHKLRALPLGLGGVAMRRNDLNTRTRALRLALRLARDSVAGSIREEKRGGSPAADSASVE
jgi:hypothetical protein